MFELLSNIQTVPVDQGALVMVQRGMNKVRVSVAEHNSEPSEVFIVTGQADGNLETYIIFYILAPGIHVIYGFDQNPYSPGLQEKVVEEATIFVEEMGSILEEVPLETMTPDQRSAWFDREVLYSEPLVVDLEEVEEVEEIEELEIIQIEDTDPDETLVLEAADHDPREGVVEVSDEDVDNALSEDDPDDGFSDSVQPGEDLDQEVESADKGVGEGVEAAGEEDVVVAEGDFDELLKQAFLKPDIVEKTRRKARLAETEFEEEDLFPEEQGASSEDGSSAEAQWEAGDREIDEDLAIDEENPVPVVPDIVVPDIADELKIGLSGEESFADETRDFTKSVDKDPPENETGLKVIRFLSKF